MRSAVIYTLEPRTATLISHLDTICTRCNGPNEAWLLEKDDDPVLYIEFYERKYWSEIEPHNWKALVRKLGSEPELAVGIDVSGRHPGKKELVGFLKAFLDRYTGVVVDDLTDYPWSATEIDEGKVIEGHAFFEY